MTDPLRCLPDLNSDASIIAAMNSVLRIIGAPPEPYVQGSDAGDECQCPSCRSDMAPIAPCLRERPWPGARDAG